MAETRTMATIQPMDDGRDSPLAHALRLIIVLAAAAGAAVLLSGIDGPFWTANRARALVDPERLSAGLLSGLVLIAAAVVLLAAGTARLLALTAALTGVAIAVATAAGEAFVAPAIGVAAVIAPVPMAVLLLALVVAVDAELAGAAVARRRVVTVLVLSALVVAGVRLLVYDPFMEIGCGVDCGSSEPLFPIPPASYLWLTRLGDAVIACAAIATIMVASRWLAFGRARGLAVGLAGIGAGLVALMQVLSTIEPGAQLVIGGRGEVAAALTIVGGLGRVLVAIGVAWWAWDSVRLRMRVEQATEELAAATGVRPVEVALAEALRVSHVSITYPMPHAADDVGPDGSALAAGTVTGLASTPVIRHGTRIATIHHPGSVDARRVTVQLSPTMLVALDIEHLRAVSLATLRLVRASRARIIAAQDTERRRVERDLHDGAQQRVLAVAMDLRLACSRATREGREDAATALRAAEAHAFAVLEELRRLARGIHPAILSQGGLGPALSSLAEEAPVPMTLDIDRSARLPALIEAIAYRAVAESLTDAARLGATEVSVAIRPDPGWVTVDVEYDGRAPGFPQRLADRVGATGGRVDVEEMTPGRHRIRAVLPCA
jgi:signal transduction histidine kinase